MWFMMDCLFAYMASEHFAWLVPFDAQEQRGLPAHQRPPNECPLPFPSLPLPLPSAPLFSLPSAPLFSLPLCFSPLCFSPLCFSLCPLCLCVSISSCTSANDRLEGPRNPESPSHGLDEHNYTA